MAFLSLGCGKKADEEKTQTPGYTNPEISDTELELSKQELFCGGTDSACPSYLTKVVILDKNKFKFCTGFLTDDNVVVTASSCLPERLRIKEIGCEGDIFFFFAQSNEKPLKVGCQKILEVSQLNSKEPYLWRSDIAYIQMDKNVYRRNVSPSRSGMDDMDKFYAWSIDQIDEYQGIIRKSENCQSIHNSYFNPLAVNQSSPVMLMAGCEFSEGNGGSPIFDYRGRVRGLISRPVAKAQIDEVISMRILERSLKSLAHVSNFACAPIYPEQDVLNEDECNKKLDINSYDMGQSNLINEANLFKTSIQRVEHTLNEKNRYLKMSVELTAVADESYHLTVVPKCFKNVSNWIGEFNNTKPFTFNLELPEMNIKKSMNEFGRILAKETLRNSTPTNFQFKPSILRNTKEATVFVWAEGPTRTFQNLSENCGSLL